MFNIDWHRLETNAEGSPQNFFEKFTYQIAVKRYQPYGLFKYFSNTPGSEFYLSLNKNFEFEGISLKTGDVIGWQAKFWLNRSDTENSPLDSRNRTELVYGFKKSLEYESNLKVWIICTPGLFPNTKTISGVKPFEELEKKLQAVKTDIKIIHWNKPVLESFAHAEPEKYGSIFNHYCATHSLSFKVFENHSRKRLDILRKRYDTDLYTPGEVDRRLLSSIFYSVLFEKLHDKIKHSLEDREKLFGSFLYSEVIDRFIKSSASPKVSDEEKTRLEKLKKLIDAFLSLHGKLHIYKAQQNTLEFIKQLFGILDSERGAINSLIGDSGLSEKHGGLDDIYIDYDSDIEQPWHLLNQLYSIAGSWLEKTIKIYRLTDQISRQVFHIFGEAGFGKTNFACYVTEQLLSKGLPVILIPASEIRATESIQEQIISSIGLNSSMAFDEFIGILDSIGFHSGIKVPIIIDGLNETQPSASTWNPQIQYIARDIMKFNNVMLVTTCRNAYSRQVFDKEQSDEIPYALTLEGFKNNIEEAISKYFTKYGITVLNKDYNRELFNNPLLLRLFSLANRGKSVLVNETGIFRAVDSYIDEIINKVATYDKDVNPQIKKQVIHGLGAYSSLLWENRYRGVAYPDAVLKCFDPSYIFGNWHDTLTHKIIDEGLLFRNVHNGNEFAEFTHDLIGGYCIAKTMFFTNKKPEDLSSLLTSEKVIKRLTSEDLTDRHPLAEDILKTMVFLAPEYADKQLFELVDNPEVVRASLQILRIVISDHRGIEALKRSFGNISPDSPMLPHLLESLLVEILRRDENIVLAELLSSVLINLSSAQLDLNWSEAIRRHSKQIPQYLFGTIDKFSSGDGDNNLNWRLTFIAFLLSSTNRYIRDMATKALVVVGRRYPDILFDVFLRIESTKDFFILERLIASIVGTLLALDHKDLIFKVCKHIESHYIEALRTSHVLILDYVVALLDYAEVNFGYNRSLDRPTAEGLLEWQQDPECVKEITGDGRATWGFGPVGYDFAKYKIGSYLAHRFEKDSKLPSLKEALAMVVWRIKELGYTEELFEGVDGALRNYEDNRSGYRGAYASTEYRKKYRDIAFYELYGHNIIKRISADFKDEDGFRVSPAYIDPTFPNVSTKRQLITCCFLPKKPEDVQGWINNVDAAFLETHYIRTDIEKDNSEWAMLYGHIVQEGTEKSRIDIGIYTIMVSESIADSTIDKIRRNELSMHYLVAENSNVWAGEIPWSKNCLDGIRHEEIEGKEVELCLPISTYHQETKSEIEIVGHAYVPSKRLAQSLGLKINLDDFNLYEESGKKASAYIHANHSSFVYIRKDLLQQYLSDTGQSMIWIEMTSKNGSLKENERNYDPSFKDLLIVNKYAN
jgi:hypothetical protein